MNISRGNAPQLPYAELLRLKDKGHTTEGIRTILYAQYNYLWSCRAITHALYHGREKIGPPAFHAWFYYARDGMCAKDAADILFNIFGFRWTPQCVRNAAHRYIRSQVKLGRM